MGTGDREKHFIKSLFILAFGTVLPKVASFITLPIYTAVLTKTEYGTYDLITILNTLLLPCATIQIQSAAYRFLIDTKEKEDVKTIVTTLSCFVVPVSVVVLFAFYFIASTLPTSLRVATVAYYFTDILLIVMRQIARGLKQNHIYSVSAILSSFLNLGLTLLFLKVFKIGLVGLVIGLAISCFVSFVYVFFAIYGWKYIGYASFSPKLLRQMIAYAWPMVPNSISLWIMRVSDRFVILYFLGIEANAIYAVANKIPNLIQIAQNTFSMAWQESASMAVKDGDSTEYYSRMFQIMHRVLAGIAALLLGFLPIIFRILIKGDYREAYAHISILILGLFFASMAVYLGGIYIANMKTKSIGLTTIIAAVINLVINLLFVKQIGIYAASLSTTISYLFLLLYRMYDIRKIQSLKYPVREMVFTELVLCGMAGLTLVDTLIGNLINLITGVAVAFFLNRAVIFHSFKAIRVKLLKH